MSRHARLRLACAGLILCLAGASPAYSASRQVVVLYDERTELPGLAVLDASLVRSLASGSADPVEIYREAMDLSRFGSETYLQRLRDYLRAKYADKKIDVAVAAMGPALDFLLSHGDAVFPKTPIVFCGIDPRKFDDRPLPSHVTGVLLKREFTPTLELALRLHPGTERIVFVAGTSAFDTQLVEQARQELRVFEDRLAFTYLTALPLRELLTRLSQLPPRTIVLYSTVFRDGAGEPFVPHDVAERIATAANAPVYAFLDQYLGGGIVGGTCTAWMRTAKRRPASPCGFWPARSRRVCRPWNPRRAGRCSTGASCSAGVSARASYPPAPSSGFASRRSGASTGST